MTFTKCCSTISCDLNYCEGITLKKGKKQKTKIFNDFFTAKRLNITLLSYRDPTKSINDLRGSYPLFYYMNNTS